MSHLIPHSTSTFNHPYKSRGKPDSNSIIRPSSGGGFSSVGGWLNLGAPGASCAFTFQVRPTKASSVSSVFFIVRVFLSSGYKGQRALYYIFAKRRQNLSFIFNYFHSKPKNPTKTRPKHQKNFLTTGVRPTPIAPQKISKNAATARIDNVWGDRNLVCSCAGMEAFLEE